MTITHNSYLFRSHYHILCLIEFILQFKVIVWLSLSFDYHRREFLIFIFLSLCTRLIIYSSLSIVKLMSSLWIIMNLRVVLVLNNNLRLVVRFRYYLFCCVHLHSLTEYHVLFSKFREHPNNLKFHSNIDYKWLRHMNDIV